MAATNVDDDGEDLLPDTRAELDSHANMICLGQHCNIIRRTNMTVKVNAFADEVGALNDIPVVDAVVCYEDPYSNERYLLLCYNALYIPSMSHHLIPPFILREAGLKVNDVPKIQSPDPDEETHTIRDSDTGMRIQLQLNGIFSYFACRALSSEEMRNWRDYPVVLATPPGRRWNPYSKIWSREEASFLDGHGRLVDDGLTSERRRLLDDEDWETFREAQAAYVDPISVQEYDDYIEESFASSALLVEEDPNDRRRYFSVSDDQIERGICDIASYLVEDELADALDKRHRASASGIAAGSISAAKVEVDELFDEDDICAIIGEATSTFSSLASGAGKGVSPERLAKIWTISPEDAQRTITQTTQLGRYGVDTTIAREFPTNDRALRYKRFLDTAFFTDTMHATAKAKSTRGFTHVQVFVSDKGFVFVHLMKALNLTEYMAALKTFCKEIGVPDTLVCDPHPVQKAGEVRRFCAELGTTLRLLERSTQWANIAERWIGLLKNGTRSDLQESNCPMVLWDFCLERRAQIMNMTARDNVKLQGQNPHTVTFNQPGDISSLCNFGWFEWCYYLEDRQKHKFPKAIAKLGRCLGPTKHNGNEMAQWILCRNGTIVPRRTLRRLTPHELSVTNEAERDKRRSFMDGIYQKFGDATTMPPEHDVTLPTIEEESDEELYEMWLDDPTDLRPWYDDDGQQAEALAVLASEVREKYYWAPEADICDASGEPISEHGLTDVLIGVELVLPHGEEGSKTCKVLRRSVDNVGKTTGVYDTDPALNTMIYDVKFPDGAVQKYAANIIAQNVLEQVEDESGHYSQRLKRVLDHRREGNAVSKGKKYLTTRNGQKKLRQSTIGWKFLIEFTDGKKQWMQLKDLKETNPVEIAEYVKAREIDDEVAFAWWVPYTLKKKARIIASVKSRAKRKTHKYGIEIPRSVEDAFRLDAENGNTLWQDSLLLEINEIGVAVKILEETDRLPPGLTRTSGHIIFDVKMDFRRKSRWVMDGHKTPEPTTSNYAGVVSRESVRIAFTYASMMGLSVMAGDIKNAYLQAPTSESHFIVCGPEFGEENEGKRAIVKRAIYGSRVAGRDFWLHLREYMETLGFQSSKGDADVWFRPAVKRDGTEYMEYVLLYVDDVLVVSENAEAVLRNEIGKKWKLKESSIEKPTIYLGGRCREVELENGIKCWAFGSSQYCQAAVKNVEEWLSKKGRSLPKRAEAPFRNGYRPEIDVSRELVGEEASYYQSLIGILRWIVELGRVDICLEVSLMSSHLALPREGHLECLYHLFAYLGKYHNSEMVFDPTKPNIDQDAFERKDWTYSTMSQADRTEVLPPDMPVPRGEGFVIRCFVDADHAGDSLTRRSRTGFIVYINNAPVYWYSKRQGSVESSTYQAEFTAMKEATEYIRALRYKLRMMGIPVEGPAYVFGDNQSVLANTTNPGSVLKKKCTAVAYHVVREGVARGEWITAYINTHLNIADLLTKPMTAGEKRNGFVKKILQHIFRKETR